MLNLRFFRAHWMSSDVIFIHKQPPLRNIGDELCSPRHYFDLRSARERLAVVGGRDSPAIAGALRREHACRHGLLWRSDVAEPAVKEGLGEGPPERVELEP